MTSPTWTRADAHRQGFTLLELLLVMAVMGVVLGLGLVRIDAVKASYFAAEEASMVCGLLRAARLDAVATRATVLVGTNPEAPQVLEQRRLPVRSWSAEADAMPVAAPRAWDGPVIRSARVAGRLRLEADGPGILFFASGASSGGELAIEADDGRVLHRLRVDAATGEVVVQPGARP